MLLNVAATCGCSVHVFFEEFSRLGRTKDMHHRIFPETKNRLHNGPSLWSKMEWKIEPGLLGLKPCYSTLMQHVGAQVHVFFEEFSRLGRTKDMHHRIFPETKNRLHNGPSLWSKMEWKIEPGLLGLKPCYSTLMQHVGAQVHVFFEEFSRLGRTKGMHHRISSKTQKKCSITGRRYGAKRNEK